MVHSVLHHAEAGRYFVHERQVQDRRANEASEHDVNSHWSDYNLPVLAIVPQLIERHYHERNLKQERQNDVRENIQTLLLLDFENPLL